MADKTATATPVDEAKAEEYKERAEADFDPAETARERLARLEAEAAETLAAARKAAKAEAKAEKEREEREVLAPLETKIRELLAEVETTTGKIFRNFSFYHKLPKTGDASVKMNYSLVTPRGESTED